MGAFLGCYYSVFFVHANSEVYLEAFERLGKFADGFAQPFTTDRMLVEEYREV